MSDQKAKSDPKVKSEMLNIRIDPETMNALRAEAAKDERTLSWLGLHYIKQALGQKKAKRRAA